MQMTLVEETDAKKRDALYHIIRAWDKAIGDGIEVEVLATATLFTALSSLVNSYGEEAIASLTERLGDRVLNGEFSMHRVEH